MIPAIRALPLIFLLTACEAFELSNRTPVQSGGKTISEASTTDNSARLRSVLKPLIQRKEALCPQNHRLLRFLFETLHAIHLDPYLSEPQKQAKAQLVFDRNRSVIESDYARMEACIAANEEEWRAIEEKEQAIVEACLPAPSEDEKPFEDARAPFRRPPPPPPPDRSRLTEDQRAELDAKLSSSACSSELAKQE